MTRSWENVQPSKQSQITHPMLAIVGELSKLSNSNKAQLEADGKGQLISLAVGDPAIDGNVPPPPEFMEVLQRKLSDVHYNGYTPCAGTPAVREAIAQYWVKWFAPSLAGKLNSNHVIVASGCSDALSMLFGAAANAGERILIPEPFFAQYDMTVAHYGIEPVYYPCDAAQNWEVKIPALRALIEQDRAQPGGGKIRAILMNNPSNPCGSNWRRAHVEELVRLMEELHIPIISDEIYAGMVFDVKDPSAEVVFTSVASVESNATRFVVAGASKRFCVPGERMGWIIQVDPTNAGAAVMKGVDVLTARFLVPMTAVQATMAECLATTGDEYFKQTKHVLCENAAYLYTQLSKTNGMAPIMPAGGMFMSVLLDMSKLDDTVQCSEDFAKLLAAEENVHVFPGEPFHMPNAFRLTLSRPMEITREAVRRLQSFCERHKASP